VTGAVRDYFYSNFLDWTDSRADTSDQRVIGMWLKTEHMFNRTVWALSVKNTKKSTKLLKQTELPSRCAILGSVQFRRFYTSEIRRVAGRHYVRYIYLLTHLF